MMNLMDLIDRKTPPTPWQEGENIPWNDPAFSERMLAEHLNQGHDAASRRSEKIDEQVQWIHRELLGEQSTTILDLACGRGLYASRFAKLGHTCVGIDYAPAAVRYAKDAAAKEDLACRYLQADVREADYGDGFGLVMMVSGQFNVFRRPDASRILAKAFDALAQGGLLLLEPQKFSTVEATGKSGTAWHSHREGLFSDKPHFGLQESFWDPATRTTTERYYIVDAATGDVVLHAMSNEAYTDEQYSEAFTEAGFGDVRFLPSLIGVKDESQSVNLAIAARKPHA